MALLKAETQIMETISKAASSTPTAILLRRKANAGSVVNAACAVLPVMPVLTACAVYAIAYAESNDLYSALKF